jgi:hypothetical protein
MLYYKRICKLCYTPTAQLTIQSKRQKISQKIQKNLTLLEKYDIVKLLIAGHRMWLAIGGLNIIFSQSGTIPWFFAIMRKKPRDSFFSLRSDVHEEIYFSKGNFGPS